MGTASKESWTSRETVSDLTGVCCSWEQEHSGRGFLCNKELQHRICFCIKNGSGGFFHLLEWYIDQAGPGM